MFYPRVQKMFSPYDMSSIDRTLLTQQTTLISLIKQNIYTLIMLHCNCYHFVLTIPLANTHKSLKHMHYPNHIVASGLASVYCQIFMKCSYTDQLII